MIHEMKRCFRLYRYLPKLPLKKPPGFSYLFARAEADRARAVKTGHLLDLCRSSDVSKQMLTFPTVLHKALHMGTGSELSVIVI